MSASAPGSSTGTELDPREVDARRSRRTWRIAAAGGVVAVALALLTGLLGGEGRVGLAVFLLVAAASCGMAALYGALTAVIDDLHGHPVSRRRPVAAAVLFTIAAMLMAMVAGAGG